MFSLKKAGFLQRFTLQDSTKSIINISMKKKRYVIIALSLLFLITSFTVFSEETFFTIQTGAFHSLKNAKKQFVFLKNRLPSDNLNLLRIEKTTRFYIVRVGKFSNLSQAKGVLRKIKTIVKDARIIKSKGAQDIIELFNEERDFLDNVIFKVNKLIVKGDYYKARSLVQKALADFGEDDRLYALLGASYLKTSEYDRAFRNFSKAISINDKRPEYFNGAGYALLFNNRPEEALFDFEKALKLKPDYSDALAGTAYAYLALGLKDKAMDIYLKLKRVDKRAASEVFKAILRAN